MSVLPAATRAAPEPLAAKAIRQELANFRAMGTILHVGAHPDDENTQLITYFSRGRGYRAAYLSLTRGDGGQNELGRDFDEKLGVARTQELLAARQLDGGRQFFTRAIDFGYSKSPEETLRFWDRDQVLGDVVRGIRRFRPDVIITRFPIPPGSGGHGHHTASAILAVEAFKLADDPAAYPEQLAQGLTVWQPKRVVWNGWGSLGPGGPSPLTGPSVSLDIGGDDPVTGESFGTIANKSRGMHKTQGLGGLSGRTASGPNVQTLLHLAGAPAGQDLMDGIDTTWARVPGGAEIIPLVDEAIAQFKADDPAASVPALLAIRARLAALPADPLVTDKRHQLDHILQSCLGLQVATTSAQAEVVPGEPLKLNYRISVLAKNVRVRHVESRSPALKLAALPGDPARTIAPAQAGGRSPGREHATTGHTGLAAASNGATDLVSGQPLTGELTGVLPADIQLTQPYWLRADGAAGISRVDDPKLIGEAENPPSIPLEHVFTIEGLPGDRPGQTPAGQQAGTVQTLILADAAVAITPDARGERRRRVDIIPPVSLAFGAEVFLFGPGQEKPVVIDVTAARAHAGGTLRLEAPAGWQVKPAVQAFDLAEAGAKARFTFTAIAPALPGSGRVVAVADIGGRRYSNQRAEVRYDHIPIQLLQPPARARVASFDLAVRAPHVGYLPGAGDGVAECLAQMGCTVRLLTGADLTPEKLAGLDAVVIGVRAFNEREDLKAAFPGLLAWVEGGGTVVAQYNRPNGLLAPDLGPYPLSIQGPAPQLRVTDETAPVTFLAPDHPALTTPNKITAADFEGWVQERGAYFPSKWDEAQYTALLAMNDPGEAALKSSVLVARHGRGHYVYTGVAFFRQLPAGVPGAYRLFANLISLGSRLRR